MKTLHKNDFDAALRSETERQTLRQNQKKLTTHRADNKRSNVNDIYQKLVVRNCPFCQTVSVDAILWVQKNGMDIIQCRKCEFVYSRQVTLQHEELASFIDEKSAQEFIELQQTPHYLALAALKYHYYLQQAERYGKKARLLDIGCCTGEFMRVAQARGWQPHGFEASAAFAAVVSQRGYPVEIGIFPEDFCAPKETYDAIVLLDSLEHLVEPYHALQQLRNALSPEGLLLIQVPNFHSPLFLLEGENNRNYCLGHWSYFTPQSLIALLTASGYRLLWLETVISELDVINRYGSAAIHAVIGKILTAKLAIPTPLTVEWLHQHLLGYKIFALFTPESHFQRNPS